MNVSTQKKDSEKSVAPQCLTDWLSSVKGDHHLTNGKAGALRLGNILVVANTIESTDAVLGYARLIAERFDGKITFLFGSASESCGIEDLKTRVLNNGGIQALRLGEIIHHPRETSLLEITNAARAKGADLIIISANLRIGTGHFFHGSMVDKIIRHAHCAVLVIGTARPELLEKQEI